MFVFACSPLASNKKLKKPGSRLHRWRKEALWRCSICPASSCLVWVAENVTSTFRTISDSSKHTCDTNNCSPKPTHIWCDSWFSPKFRGSWRYRMLKLILDPCDWRLGMFYQCPAPSSLFVSPLYLYVAEFIWIHNMVYRIKANIHIGLVKIPYITMIPWKVVNLWLLVLGCWHKRISFSSFLAAKGGFPLYLLRYKKVFVRGS